MKITTQLITAASLVALLTGCSSPNEFKPAEGMSPVDTFSAACASCHGENGGGKFGFLLKLTGSDNSVNEIASKIQQGSKLMPSFPNLSEAERMSIAAYVKSL